MSRSSWEISGSNKSRMCFAVLDLVGAAHLGLSVVFVCVSVCFTHTVMESYCGKFSVGTGIPLKWIV